MVVQKDIYYKGYIAGYKDGIQDGIRGKSITEIDNDICKLPIKAMNLSTRAYNCLIRAGCVYISDVVSISDRTIETIRNLGTKTASEIASCLHGHGITYSAWSKYL